MTKNKHKPSNSATKASEDVVSAMEIELGKMRKELQSLRLERKRKGDVQEIALETRFPAGLAQHKRFLELVDCPRSQGLSAK